MSNVSVSSPRPPDDRSGGFKQDCLVGLLIVALTLVIYAPSMKGGLLWDDDLYLSNNPTVKSPDGIARIWTEPFSSPSPYPLVFTALWIEYHLWGLDTLGYHLVNVLLHSANSILLGLILSRLAVPGAALSAVIFAFHPVHVESVAWITELKDTLSGTFYFLSIWFWLMFIESKRRSHYALTALLYLGAMLSKTVTATLPAILLLIAWWKEPENWKCRIRFAVPLLGFAVALGTATVWWERSHLGASGEKFHFSILQRCLIAGRVPWFYTAKLLWPAPLMTIYPRWELALSMRTIFFPIATFLSLVAAWLLRGRLGRGVLSAGMFFLITIAPASGFFNFTTMLYSFAADHYQYLAGAGWIALVGACFARTENRIRGPSCRLLRWVFLLLAAGLAGASWTTSEDYKDLKSLFSDTLSKNPKAWVAHYNVGWALSEEGNLEEAIRHYSSAIELRPDYAKALNNLGEILLRQTKNSEARDYFSRALAAKPNYAEAMNNMGSAWLHEGNRDQASDWFHRAIQTAPQFADAHFNLGLLCSDEGKLDEAIESLSLAVQWKPGDAEALNALGSALGRRGKSSESAEYFYRAIRLKPDFAEAIFNLGVAQLEMGNLGNAAENFNRASQILSEYRAQAAEALNEAGLTRLGQGNTNEAIKVFSMALNFVPNSPEIQANLRVAQSHSRR